MNEKKNAQPSMSTDALGLAQADLTEQLAETMRRASRAYVVAVVEALGQKGYAGLTPASVSLLARLPPQGSQTIDLARQTRRTKQAAGKIVADLVKQGYAERLPDPKDGRAQLVRPTEKGLEALTIGADVKLGLAERATIVLGVDTLERLHKDLASLEKALRAEA